MGSIVFVCCISVKVFCHSVMFHDQNVIFAYVTFM